MEEWEAGRWIRAASVCCGAERAEPVDLCFNPQPWTQAVVTKNEITDAGFCL